MSITLLVDPASSLHPKIVNEFSIQVFHMQVKLAGKVYDESRDPVALREFYAALALTDPANCSQEPFTRDHVHHHFTEYVINSGGYALVQAGSEQTSDLLSMCNEVQPFVLKTYRAMRERGQIDGHFGLRVMSSGVHYAGLGLLAIYTCELIDKDTSKHDLLLKVDQFKDLVYSYTVAAANSPKVTQLSDRKGFLSSLTGKNSAGASIIQSHQNTESVLKKLGSVAESVDSVFAQVTKNIESGLHYPVVSVIYAGDDENLKVFVSYNEMLTAAKKHKVEVITSMMSMTAAIDLGFGAVSVAFSSEKPLRLG